MGVTPISDMQVITTIVVILTYIGVSFILRRYCDIYYLDYMDEPKFIGRAHMYANRFGFYISVKDRVIKKALTRRLLLAPNTFYIGRKYDAKTVIFIKNARHLVGFDDEMEVVI